MSFVVILIGALISAVIVRTLENLNERAQPGDP